MVVLKVLTLLKCSLVSFLISIPIQNSTDVRQNDFVLLEAFIKFVALPEFYAYINNNGNFFYFICNQKRLFSFI